MGIAGVAGCGDTVTFIDCPPGTVPEGSECIPIEDTGQPDSTVADSTANDSQTAPTDTGVTPTDTGSDTGTDTGPTPQPVGSPCIRNADCTDGTCLDWTGGYCTKLGCGDSGCPTGSTCVALSAGNEICVADCNTSADCVEPAQACKQIDGRTDASGLVAACIGVDSDAGGTGDTCADPTDCVAEATCLSAFPGGYCGALGCTASSCPADARCVGLNDRPTCLRRCTDDAACDSMDGAERACGVLLAVNGNEAQVCISGLSGAAVGESCLSDFECESGTCEVIGEGRCSQTDTPCFTATVAEDCNGAEFCFIGADTRSGVCARPCALGGIACQGDTFCLAEGADPNRGTCRPRCGQGTTVQCASDLGFSCRYGLPISDSGQGRYVCSRSKPRSFGATCINGSQCASADCVVGDPGYCSQTCGDDGYCPFPGSCVFDGANERCHLACFTSGDCPTGQICDQISGSARPVCVPQ
ncbi:MAG: hypothetical protein ACI9MR_003701 [Myxococcota bacterium]|jgi:hypothetical protein